MTALSTLGKLRGTRFFPLQEAEVSMIVVSAIPVLALGLLVLFAGIVLYRRLSKKEKQLDEE